MTILIANWKMHGSEVAARDYAFKINEALEMAPASLECVFCPPFTSIAAAKSGLPQNARLRLGAQNCHGEREGSFTGEVSAPMLKDAGCSYVIIGHSECRLMGESDTDVARKAQTAIEVGLRPIICIGESEADYQQKRTEAVLDTQLALLKKLPKKSFLIAYEPVWAIGSGKTPKSAEIKAAHAHIKTILGRETPVLYGGSVKPANLGEILQVDGVDGALIGGASREIADMTAILSATGKLNTAGAALLKAPRKLEGM